MVELLNSRNDEWYRDGIVESSTNKYVSVNVALHVHKLFIDLKVNHNLIIILKVLMEKR